MIKVQQISLTKIMPANLLQDKKVKAAAIALDKELINVSEQMKQCLLLARLDELEEKTVDLLAWQFHVNFYSDALPLDKKRNLIKKSIDWHRRKGTPYAVQEIVSAILDGAVVRENWEYSGKPYCFKVDLIEGAMASSETITELVKAIQTVKNTRSHLDGIGFIRKTRQTIYIGGAIQQHKQSIIGPAVFTMPNINGENCFVGCGAIHKEVNIKWQTGTV